MTKKRWMGTRFWLKNSIWVWPVALAVFFLILTSLRVSGTSIGSYDSRLYGPNQKDTGIVYGHPRDIRSDEWLVSTQEIISQSRNGFPRFNKDMTDGQDLSLQAEIPTKDWSAIFKPQNWSFFVLPLEYAFAFKWWLLMYLLIISCYFFILRLLPERRLVAILLSASIGLTPFELWWYQTGGFLTVAYGFFLILVLMRLMKNQTIPFVSSRKISYGLYSLLLVFLMVCFGLILYPPFQIAIAVVLLFFSIGYVLQSKSSNHLDWPAVFTRLIPVFVGLVLTGLIGITFIVSHRAPIHALNSSIYPGHRVVKGGDLRLLNVFDSYTMPFVQSDYRGSHFISNQSEESNFILLMPFLLIPSIFLLFYEHRIRKRFDWILAALTLCGLLMLIRVFTTWLDPFFKLLFLQKVPDKRLIIGFGFLSVIQMIYLLKKAGEVSLSRRLSERLPAAYSLASLAVLVLISFYIKRHFPGFVLNDFVVLLALAVLFCSMIYVLLSNRGVWFAAIFFVFSVGSSFRIIPLYRGLGVPYKSTLISEMDAVSRPGDTWVTVGTDATLFENFGIDAGRRSISGTQVYPNLKFWSQVGGPKYDDIFNREGHAFFVDNSSQSAPAQLLQGDAFLVKFQCSDFILRNAQYALSIHPLSESCAHLVKMVRYPAVTFYLYRISS